MVKLLLPLNVVARLTLMFMFFVVEIFIKFIIANFSEVLLNKIVLAQPRFIIIITNLFTILQIRSDLIFTHSYFDTLLLHFRVTL